tara:strand:+ start:13592 stop:14941 length:1350 start_codon:yes stop_codon:yes gene_type:complete
MTEKVAPRFFETNDYKTLYTEQKIALHAAFSGINMLITGGGGVGKSHWINILSRLLPSVVITASTGSAATKIEGITLDRLMGFPGYFITPEEAALTNRQLRDKFQEVTTILIDEASMLRIDKFENLNTRLQNIKKNKKPFGGLQIILVADFCQLQPVIGKNIQEKNAINKRYRGRIYAFESDVYKEANITPFVLTKYLRQDNLVQQKLLKKIRVGHDVERAVNEINKLAKGTPSIESTYLCATNALADKINEERYQAVKGLEHFFHAEKEGDYPTANVNNTIKLKVGVRVIICANKPRSGYHNGDQGLVANIHKDSIDVILDNGNTVSVTKHKWKEYDIKAQLNSSGERESIGSFEQLPVRLAYAITIHKSQGMTLKNVVIDLSSRFFAPFMAYVALSRVVSFENLHLTRALKPSDIKIDIRAVNFTRDVSLLALSRQEEYIAKYGIAS